MRSTCTTRPASTVVELCSCLTCPTCRRPVKDAKTMAWIEEFSTKEEEEWLPEEVIDEDDIPMRVQRTRARRRQAAILASKAYWSKS